jgi:hypothetical protein
MRIKVSYWPYQGSKVNWGYEPNYPQKYVYLYYSNIQKGVTVHNTICLNLFYLITYSQQVKAI